MVKAVAEKKRKQESFTGIENLPHHSGKEGSWLYQAL
jgi:hypothetical protein